MPRLHPRPHGRPPPAQARGALLRAARVHTGSRPCHAGPPVPHVLVQPFEFEAAEVGADGQPRDRAEVILDAQLLGHPSAELTGADVQPHDRVAQRLARVPVPDDSSLPLVGDAQSLDRYGAVFGFGLLQSVKSTALRLWPMSASRGKLSAALFSCPPCSCVFLALMHATSHLDRLINAFHHSLPDRQGIVLAPPTHKI